MEKSRDGENAVVYYMRGERINKNLFGRRTAGTREYGTSTACTWVRRLEGKSLSELIHVTTEKGFFAVLEESFLCHIHENRQ